MMHLAIVYTTILESSLLKLPVEVITAVFNYVSQTPAFRHAKIILNAKAQSDEQHVAYPKEVGGRANQYTFRFKCSFQLFQNNMTWERQMLNHFGEKDRIKSR